MQRARQRGQAGCSLMLCVRTQPPRTAISIHEQNQTARHESKSCRRARITISAATCHWTKCAHIKIAERVVSESCKCSTIAVCVSNVHKGLLHLSLSAAFLSTHQSACKRSAFFDVFDLPAAVSLHDTDTIWQMHRNFYVIFHSGAAGGMKLKVLAANQLSQWENRRK